MVDRNTEGRLAAAKAEAGPLSLLVMADGGVFTCPMPARTEVTLGRSEACDVHVDDPKLSRKHAILKIAEDGQAIILTDLGSMNGSFIGDRRVDPHVPSRVGVGEMIAIGSTVFVVQAAATASREWRLWTKAQFEERLASECERATKAGGIGDMFALLKLGFRNPRDADEIEGVLGDTLRKKDVVASSGPGVYAILLVETSDVTADAIASRITSQLHENGVEVDMHVAVYPRDGDTPDLLFESEGAPPSRRVPMTQDGSLVAGGAMRQLQPMIEKIAAGTINVLVMGETGVGKEIVARTIHARSPRSSRPLVCINCAALSESLLESELFGHEKGAFTGAMAAKEGLLESAQGGTVFLDEVGEMPLALQAKLLRVLEQREVLRVGSLKPRPIDVRFVAATNRDLEAESLKGCFRQDLFFRLNGISIVIPPLRLRVDEIEGLATTFLRQACVAAGRRGEVRFSAQAMALLKRYAWPGNVRELRNVVERAVLLSSGETITLEHLPCDRMGPVMEIRGPRASQSSASVTVPPPASSSRSDVMRFSGDERVTLNDPASLAALHSLVRPRVAQGDEERARIVEALERCAGNQTQAAKLLGISRRTLVTRLQVYDLPRPRKRAGD